MPIILRKDKTNLTSETKIKAGKKHYFNVYLWDNVDDMRNNTCQSWNSIACVCFTPTTLVIHSGGYYEKVKPKLGEIHFVKDHWDNEIVSHELQHAMIHRIRCLEPRFEDILEQEGNSEEDICYEFGYWAYKIYEFLHDNDGDI